VALFLALLLGHLLGDFVFQPGRLVAAKRHSNRGVLLHTGIVTACTAIVLLGDIARMWPAVLLSGAAHIGIEYLTIRARKMMEASGLELFLLDQALHVVSLVILAVCLGGASRPFIATWPVTITVLAASCGLVAVMFFSSILAFEVRTAALGAADSTPTGPILGMDAARVFGFAERGIALGIGLVAPIPVLGVVAFVPRVVFALTRSSAGRAQHMSDAAIGLLTCALAWLLIVAVSATSL